MAIKFNEAVFTATTSEWNYSSEGTLASNCKGYAIKFTKKNLASDKRVTLILTKGNKRFTLSCSAPLSKLVRKALATKEQNEVLGSLMQLEIMADNDDSSKYFLCQPQGDGEMLPEFKVDELVKANVSYEDVLF
jgi:hypothetical protein